MMRFLWRPFFGAFAVFLSSFIVYLLTLAPGVGFIDSGELATVCSTLGVAHPTGYPLFTLIGFVFAQLPVAATVIMRLNIMSALFSALGAGAMVYLGHEIHAHWLVSRAKKIAKVQKKGKVVEVVGPATELQQQKAVAAGIFTGLLMAFSETWWANATSIEVYPLHVFFIPVVLTFFLRMLREGENAHARRDGMIFALTLGLSFSNHLTTILLAPACLYMFFGRFGFSAESFKRIGRLIPPFLVGLLPYVFLFVRASSGPLMNWGNPDNLRSFLRHVTGVQYKIWMFTGSGAGKQFSYFWQSLPSEFIGILSLLAVAGIWALWRARARKAAHILPFVLLLFFACILYAINYDIHDIDSYFLLAYIAFGLLLAAGVAGLASLENRITRRTSASTVTLLLALILSSVEVVEHWETNDESGNHMVDDYTRNMLTNLPPHAIVFSTAWDFWVSGAFYWQHVEKLRPDVTVVDAALLRDRPWYYGHVKQVAPEVLQNAQAEFDAFFPHLERYARGEPYDGAAITKTYLAFTEALIRNNSARPIFVTSDLLAERDELFAPSFKGIPAGLAYRFTETDTLYLPTQIPKLVWRAENYSKRNYYTDNARLMQAAPLGATAVSFARHGRIAEAKAYLDLAMSFAPDPKVDLNKLRDRDREFAIMVDTRFAEYEALRRRLQ